MPEHKPRILVTRRMPLHGMVGRALAWTRDDVG